jgi:hypothetical protein
MLIDSMVAETLPVLRIKSLKPAATLGVPVLSQVTVSILTCVCACADCEPTIDMTQE